MQLRDVHYGKGWKGSSVLFYRTASVQYSNQGWELTIPVRFKPALKPSGRALDISALLSDFGRKHRQVYGYTSPADPVNIASLNLTSVIVLPKVRRVTTGMGSAAVSPGARVGERNVLYPDRERLSAIYSRAELRSGNSISGPAIIEQYDSTTLIPGNWKVRVDGYSNLIMRRRK